MDKRNTLANNETFLQVLTDSKDRGTKVFMLYEDQGVTRADGFVKEIGMSAPIPFIVLNNGKKIELKTIIAVNGLFDPSYSEC